MIIFFPPSYNNDLKNLITYVVFLSLEFKLRYVFSLKILKLFFFIYNVKIASKDREKVDLIYLINKNSCKYLHVTIFKVESFFVEIS